MASTFDAQTRKLEAAVGSGKLVMKGVVHEAYAAAEHNKSYRHTTGIRGYLAVPFAAQLDEMMVKLARAAITKEGSKLRSTAREISEMFDEMTQRFAPVRTGTLKNATNSYVIDDGRVIYASIQRAPNILGKYDNVPG